MSTLGLGSAPEQSQPTDVPSFGGYAGGPGQLLGVGFGLRFLARLIDHVLHYAVTFASAVFFGVMVGVIAVLTHGDTVGIAGKVRALGLLQYVFPLIGYTGYMIICEAMHGSSLGKLILGIVVVTDEGRPCGFAAAMKRSLAYFVDALFFGLIGYMQMQKSPQEKRHGDNWAGTIVIKRSDAPAGSLRSAGRFVAAFFLGVLFDAATAWLMLAVAVLS